MTSKILKPIGSLLKKLRLGLMEEMVSKPLIHIVIGNTQETWRFE
jgi:hypothetical protein